MHVGALALETDALLSGGQAAARGAIEAGIALAIGYPGTPGSEAVEACLPAAGPELRVEWAVNEKLAVEIAAGVAWSGKRALVAMKMSGLNVAADSVLSITASGVNGGLVLLVADDPNAYYGMVEQDSRYYALMGALPLLEPATPQEALDFARLAFDLSERTGAPILLRLTTVLAQNTATVVARAPERTRVRGAFAFDPDRYTKAGAARCRAQHQGALARAAEVGRLLEPLARRQPGTGRTGAIGVGVAWRYLLEARARVAPDAPLLKLPASYPLPETRVAEFLADLDRVLVVEELEPVVEMAVRSVAAGRPGLVVLGKLGAGKVGPGKVGPGKVGLGKVGTPGADRADAAGVVGGADGVSGVGAAGAGRAAGVGGADGAGAGGAGAVSAGGAGAARVGANGWLLPRVGDYDVDLVAGALQAAIAHGAPIGAGGAIGSGAAVMAGRQADAASRQPIAGHAEKSVAGYPGEPIAGHAEKSVAGYPGEPVAGYAEEPVTSRADGPAVVAGRADAAPLPDPAGPRPPVFPAGCPHRATYMALQQALASLGLKPRDAVVTGDVGCAALGALEPVSTCATEVAMGASIGVAQGFVYAGIGKPVIALIGDGSFFHAGLPALAGAVHRQVDLTLLVLDNGTTCMTGGQPHLGSPARSNGTRQIKVEDVARAFQVKRVTVVDPYDVKRTATAIAGAVRGRGVSIVIARRACEAFRPEPPAPPLVIRAKRCVGVAECGNSCIAVTACPALQVDAAGKARIEASACVGCRLCESVCPKRAIRRPWRFGVRIGAARGR